MARLVVTAVLVEGRSKSAVAEQYGVSRRWVITLVQRYLAEGEAGLAPRSRRPHASPDQTPDAVEDEIIKIRKELARGGHEAGAATIAFHLEKRHGSSPSVSTIWRILKARGFVTPQPHKRPKSSYLRFVADLPNERWQTDTTHWHILGTGKQAGRLIDVEVLNWIDDHSRLNMSSTCQRTFKSPDVDRVFREITALHGDPATLLTDNGAIFTGRSRGHGRVALEVTLHERGIASRHSRPYHPQTCGKVERFHQTQKKWLAHQSPARSLHGLQSQLDRFRAYYNEIRPHRALPRITPAQAYLARPKALPAGAPLHAEHWRIRHDRVHDNGAISLRYDSKLRHIGLGRDHAGTDVLVLVKDLDIRVLTNDGQLIRELVLDPTRNYQPQAKR